MVYNLIHFDGDTRVMCVPFPDKERALMWQRHVRDIRESMDGVLFTLRLHNMDFGSLTSRQKDICVNWLRMVDVFENHNRDYPTPRSIQDLQVVLRAMVEENNAVCEDA